MNYFKVALSFLALLQLTHCCTIFKSVTNISYHTCEMRSVDRISKCLEHCEEDEQCIAAATSSGNKVIQCSILMVQEGSSNLVFLSVENLNIKIWKKVAKNSVKNAFKRADSDESKTEASQEPSTKALEEVNTKEPETTETSAKSEAEATTKTTSRETTPGEATAATTRKTTPGEATAATTRESTAETALETNTEALTETIETTTERTTEIPVKLNTETIAETTPGTRTGTTAVTRAETTTGTTEADDDTTAVTTVTPACPNVFTETTQGCFYVVKGQKAWDSAEETCQDYGNHVHLVSIDSEEKMDKVTELMFEDAVVTAWTGARGWGESRYKYIGTKSEVPDTFWEWNQPNHPSGDCVMLNGGTKKVSISACSHTYFFVCEA